MSPRSRRGTSSHHISWSEVDATALEYQGSLYTLERAERTLVVNDGASRFEVGHFAMVESSALTVKVTPGCETYYEARRYHGHGFNDRELAASVIVAAIGGHPDADEDRAGTMLSAVWSHHLAIVGGDDPRWVATTYAPSETKIISGRIQHMYAVGVRLVARPEERI